MCSYVTLYVCVNVLMHDLFDTLSLAAKLVTFDLAAKANVSTHNIYSHLACNAYCVN